jgi:hypothetical protein
LEARSGVGKRVKGGSKAGEGFKDFGGLVLKCWDWDRFAGDCKDLSLCWVGNNQFRGFAADVCVAGVVWKVV